MLLMNMSLNQPTLFPLCPHPIAWYFNFEKCQESVSHGLKNVLSARVIVFHLMTAIMASERQNRQQLQKKFEVFSSSPFTLQGVMQSNLGKRPGVAGALMCKRLLC